MEHLQHAGMIASHFPQAGRPPAQALQHGDMSILLHEGGIPSFLQAELDRLYGHLFSSSAMFKVCGIGSDANVYTAQRGGQYTTILVYRVKGRAIEVLNEQIRCEREEIRSFADCVFRRYPIAKTIRLKAIQVAGGELGYPYQRTPFSNDVILKLPQSADEYLSALGKSTRDNIRRYLKLLKRDFPSHQARIIESKEVSEALVEQVVSLSHKRMRQKRKGSGISGEEEKRLFALIRECGLMTTIEIDGRLCAGTILYRVGENFFLRVLAHDPAYDKHRLGLLCCYLSICECIARGGKKYHFLWGRETYKYRLLGEHLDLDLLTVYRSNFHAAMDGTALLKNAVAANLRNLKWQLIELEPRAKPVIQIARRALHILKEPLGRHRMSASESEHGI